MTKTADFIALLLDYLEDAAGHLDSVESALLELEKCVASGAGGEQYLLHMMGSLHTLKGNSGMMGFSAVQTYIHQFESTLKPVSEGAVQLTAALVETCYTAINVLRRALKKLAENPEAEIDLSEEITRLETPDNGESLTVPALPSQRKSRDDLGYISQKSGTLKVNFEKLDDLLNLVGELVIHRTALLSLESRFKEAVTDRALLESFNGTSQSLGKTANDLRDAIMKVRMLPIKAVFQRFNRLVRDLSHSHGKKINLVFAGEETELDKTVIDEIGEPLLHLIRNAVDHGIETQAERHATGKPAVATLRLSACHESSNIVISVADDGRGMSAEKIKASAIAKGLLEKGEAEVLNEQEAFQLVFMPGFSTSSEVTETSGRGIGLDVVQKTVSSLNGTIDIKSSSGQGTQFTIKLPLTLAIIQSLMVETAGEVFAIPLAGVLESIRLDAAEIHRVASGELIKLRDRLLPIVRLDNFFGFERAESREKEYIVIVGSGEKRGGIVVDRLLGQQEIVIKGMDDYLGNLPGISGGTVLGDGKVSLIIDIASLLAKTKEGGKYEGKR